MNASPQFALPLHLDPCLSSLARSVALFGGGESGGRVETLGSVTPGSPVVNCLSTIPEQVLGERQEEISPLPSGARGVKHLPLALLLPVRRQPLLRLTQDLQHRLAILGADVGGERGGGDAGAALAFAGAHPPDERVAVLTGHADIT